MSLADCLFSHPAARRWALPLATALIAVACGGGVDTGGTGSEPQTVASGPIAGFGSIVIDGVHFDESTASVVDDEGSPFARGDLKLGMMVKVRSGPIEVDTNEVERARAGSVQFGSELRGAVQSVDAVAGSLVVLGQTVTVNLDTVFDGLPTGLAGVQTGQVVEVHALVDAASGVLLATRIELKPGASDFKLKGVVSNLDAGARRFSIGGMTVGYAAVPSAEVTGLADGLSVHVRLLPAAQQGLWIASHIYQARSPIEDGVRAKLEGIVSGFVSLSNFRLDGVTVDAGGPGVIFKRGSSAQLANGVHLKVDGVVRAGVLVARKVDVKGADGGDDDFRLQGEIQSLDTAGKTFLLRGVVVAYTNETRFLSGSAADLMVGVGVTVDGPLSSTGNRVVATRIKFDVQGTTDLKHED